jgi:hypothetical protein
MTSLTYDKVNECAAEITKRFRETGEAKEVMIDEEHGIMDVVFISNRYRRAHISVVDARETLKLLMLHVTIFPHTNDDSPIFGFDIIAGPSRISGAFHDFSSAGNSWHYMMQWFEKKVEHLNWNKQRTLPDWAAQIFSPSMIAVGGVNTEIETDQFIKVGLENLDYYLSNVGNTQESMADFHMAQNRYCHYQKQNPHTPRVMTSLGLSEQRVKEFIRDVLFPEIV